MEEPDQSPQPLASSSSSSSSSGSRNEEVSGTASTSTSTSQARDEEHEEEEEEVEDHYQPPHLVQQQTSVSYHAHFPTSENEAFTYIRDDTWSCVIVVLTFWFFVSMTMILGVYGSVTLRLGPNSSRLIKPNALLVESITVEQLDDTISGQMLYGFYKDPPLDVVTDWSETHNASLLPRSHVDWAYFLNEGSEINISYTVKSSSSYSLILVIAQGNQGLAQWLQDPSYSNTTLSWNNIHGNGLIQQDIRESSNYYIAMGNLNSEVVEVQLNLKMRDFLYNTTEAYYKCTLARGQCSLKIFFPHGNAAVLTTPGPKPGTSGDEWYVKLSYGPRWITHLVGIGGMTVLMLLAFHFFNNFRCNREARSGVRYGEMGSERAPLLSQKDDDLLSWGSSYDSLSQDDEDPEDGLVGSLDGKPLKDGEYNNNTRRLCAICFDAPRDCFFLPCGHCVACFACGTRIAEAAGTCPICRRNMKKVRKIFTV